MQQSELGERYSLAAGDALKARFFPEVRLAGFSHVDGTIAMYGQIAALIRSTDIILEFGAGRGGNISDDPSPYRRQLQTLRGRCARVFGCDIDPVILENPFLDEAVVIQPGAPLPFANDSFDIIVSNNVFEHIADAENTATELLRVLKPGGVLCANTPNKWGYVAMSAMLVHNSLHASVLRKIQPHRRAVDVFPTLYRMNTPKTIQRLFGDGADIFLYLHSAEPSYHFGNRWIFSLFKLLHKILPERWSTTMYLYIQRR